MRSSEHRSDNLRDGTSALRRKRSIGNASGNQRSSLGSSMLFTVEMWPQGARASSLALRGGCVKPRASGLVRQASRFGARVECSALALLPRDTRGRLLTEYRQSQPDATSRGTTSLGQRCFLFQIDISRKSRRRAPIRRFAVACDLQLATISLFSPAACWLSCRRDRYVRHP